MTDHTVTIPGDLFARHQTITGLRALADFLETHPEVPVPEFGADVAYYPDDTDEAERAQVDHIATLLDVTVADHTTSGGHYTAYRSFGRITYKAVHIPDRTRQLHDAEHSYSTNIRAAAESASAPSGSEAA